MGFFSFNRKTAFCALLCFLWFKIYYYQFLKMPSPVSGFSKLSKAEKILWLRQNFLSAGANSPDPDWHEKILEHFWSSDTAFQNVFDNFSENTVSNYHLPYSIAPNFLIDGRLYAVPMVTEESSVVAAASAGAKFWLNRGGFTTRIINNLKEGQIHFTWSGDAVVLNNFVQTHIESFFSACSGTTERMEKRGGGISSIILRDFNTIEPQFYQLQVQFKTADAMGANFINSVLEELSQFFSQILTKETQIEPTIIMSILSNYTPDCVVESKVQCKISDFGDKNAHFYTEKFRKAVRIAQIDTYRAVTHNKGIMNGVDSVVLATGNDFRAIEAGAHAYAARNGMYKSLSECIIEDNIFTMRVTLPLAVGTVGGLTRLHPLAKLSLELLQSPTSEQLMSIMASVGLAQNFAAVRSLVTTGIQKGHMKLHLSNILNEMNASKTASESAQIYFEQHTVSVNAVRDFLQEFNEKR